MSTPKTYAVKVRVVRVETRFVSAFDKRDAGRVARRQDEDERDSGEKIEVLEVKLDGK